jgi:hypothetical protein
VKQLSVPQERADDDPRQIARLVRLLEILRQSIADRPLQAYEVVHELLSFFGRERG